MEHKKKTKLYDAACHYVEKLGWYIFPLCPKGKTPLIKGGFKNASSDLKQIKSWWTQYPDANIGIPTGEKNKIWVLDLDGEYPKDFPQLPKGLSVKSAKGSHHYFSYPKDREIRNKTRIKDFEVDIRGEGGYIVAPPSIHPTGIKYEMIKGCDELKEAPKALIDFLFEEPKQENDIFDAPHAKADFMKPTEHSIDDVREMLNFINPDNSYDEWCKIGMALCHSGHSIDLWIEWSSKGEKFNRGECQKKWQSFSSGHGVTIGTLIHFAKQNGFKFTKPFKAKNRHNKHAKPLNTNMIDKESETGFVMQLENGTHLEIAEQIKEFYEYEYGNFIYCEGDFYIYKNGYWNKLDHNDVRRTLHTFNAMPYGDDKIYSLTKDNANSILNELSVMCEVKHFFDNHPQGINCLSGFIQIDDNGDILIEPHSPDHKQRFIIQASYNPHITAPQGHYLNILIDGCFKEDSDKQQKKDFLGELLGCAALGYSTHLTEPKAVIFHGEKAENGKSQIINLFKTLLPNEVITNIAPKDFTKPENMAHLSYSAFNSCAELSANAITSNVFKEVITGDETSGRYLYKNTIFFYPKALHIFATNVLPTFKSGIDNGIKRRLAILIFNRKIPKSERIPKIAEKIRDHEMDALLAFAIQGAQRLLKNGAYTVPESSKNALLDWEERADPVRAWVSSCVTLKEANRLAKSTVYQQFRIWALDQGYGQEQIPKTNNFTQRLKAIIPELQEPRTSKTRYFEGIEVTDTLIEDIRNDFEV